mgnify:CR=1 FL=1
MNEQMVQHVRLPQAWDLLQALEGEVRRGSSGSFVVESSDEVRERLCAHPQRWEILNLDSLAGRLRDRLLAELPAEHDRLRVGLARGLSSKLLLTQSTADDPGFRPLQLLACAFGEQTRVRRSLPFWMIVIDREVAVLERPGFATGGVFVTTPEIIDNLVATFQHLWKGARLFNEHANAARQREQVGDLLCDGLTDEAIARRLSIGTRTVSRLVATLMAEHECRALGRTRHRDRAMSGRFASAPRSRG